MAAWRKAARGKRGTGSVARFEYRAEEQIAEIREQLLAGTYRPGAYVHFQIEDPKRRRISAAPFRDRVVHHALCSADRAPLRAPLRRRQLRQPRRRGAHAALDRAAHRYALRADIVQHFASIDHAVLLAILGREIPEPDVMALTRTIVASGRGRARRPVPAGVLPGRRPAGGLPPARAADRQPDLAVLVELLPAPARPVREAWARLFRLPPLRRRLRALQRQQAAALGLEARDHRAARAAPAGDP